MIDNVLHLRVIENKDWATILFVISFATVAITKSAFENRFAEFAKLIYSDKYTNMYKDGSNLKSSFTIALFFVQLISFAFFLGVWVWAYSRSNKERFDEAAQLPFEQD